MELRKGWVRSNYSRLLSMPVHLSQDVDESTCGWVPVVLRQNNLLFATALRALHEGGSSKFMFDGLQFYIVRTDPPGHMWVRL